MIDEVIRKLTTSRAGILERFAEAWLAANMPDQADGAWIANNCQLVEVRGEKEWTYFYKRREAAVLMSEEFDRLWEWARDYSTDYTDMKRLLRDEIFNSWGPSLAQNAEGGE